jgi:hypothetical protein
MTYADTPQFDPIKAAWNTVATYPTYDEAQSAVRQLSEDGFPIENIDIVGSDLRLVERVTGQATKLRATGHGALTGAGLGSFFGLLLGLFSPGFAWIGLIFVGAMIGATWGAAFGFASHAVTAGRSGFSSTRNLVAAHYDLVIRGGYTEDARGILGRAGMLPTP